eukprot:CAMPEP_0178457916 /NCGR_PEP_ID=MMETSP0689_2-20121128/47272_1 /TAXON_ID=160604 /ORGANISM="Amphidinium massartii, Strain CS-259" /LENGTH=66 /DNA_ID=CAMNT_0020084199 /DNA_START=82 /DNA_END=279 /DNA_ORIENTATION=+
MALFNMLDRNHDGKITRSEFNAAMGVAPATTAYATTAYAAPVTTAYAAPAAVEYVAPAPAQYMAAA